MSSKATFVEGGPVCVLTLARDRLHAGWQLLTHPLYGNVQPSQQPFRSILVGLSEGSNSVDHDSLSILERAIGLYRSTGGSWDKTGEKHLLLEDFADLDVHLMRDSLEKYGLLR
ncbi:MAG: GrdX family protein [Thermovirgaceae bacterium]|nr:GrdX family protein [Synergistales bacterium]MDI9392954.1 GrdX family protein [Synergistota bacterium]MDY0178649.1 GrdX family protein [Synergistaceae bacterium]HRW87349.1 GrdX family protein [Thermovirgaceae bacterium]MDD3829989.1 GrdX family protein [Synergistales bacterium]